MTHGENIILESSKLKGQFYYNTWKFCITNFLQKDDLLDIVEPNVKGVVEPKQGDIETWS